MVPLLKALESLKTRTLPVVLLLAVTLSLSGGCAWPSFPTFPANPTDTPLPAVSDPVTQPPPTAHAVGGQETIVILHTNDFHGAIEPRLSSNGKQEYGGLVNLVSLIDKIRAEDPERTLVLDAGDSFQGTYVSNSTEGQVVMEAMNLAGYDAWSLGNHEFDWGQQVLKARIEQATFPVLAANVVDAKTGKVWAPVKPYVVVNVGRVRVAILGLGYPNTPGIVKPQTVEGLRFLRAPETVRQYLPEMEEQADLIVILSHAGYDNDVALAKAVDGLDVIVGGHTHKFIEWPSRVNGAIIAQAGAKGQALGVLRLTVDLDNGVVADYERDEALVEVTGDVSPVNPKVKALVDDALIEASETMNLPIGESATTLQPQREGEFALGNLIVDAMLAAEIDGQSADIAWHNNGGIRAGLRKGSITFGQLYEVLPFDNQLMALDLTGAQVLEILEHSVADRAGGLQTAGVTYQFSMSRPVGKRVIEAWVGGEKLDPRRTYRVITIDYLATGGDGFRTFLEGENVGYGDNEVWVVAEYIRSHSPVRPQVEGRIVQK